MRVAWHVRIGIGGTKGIAVVAAVVGLLTLCGCMQGGGAGNTVTTSAISGVASVCASTPCHSVPGPYPHLQRRCTCCRSSASATPCPPRYGARWARCPRSCGSWRARCWLTSCWRICCQRDCPPTSEGSLARSVQFMWPASTQRMPAEACASAGSLPASRHGLEQCPCRGTSWHTPAGCAARRCLQGAPAGAGALRRHRPLRARGVRPGAAGDAGRRVPQVCGGSWGPARCMHVCGCPGRMCRMQGICFDLLLCVR